MPERIKAQLATALSTEWVSDKPLIMYQQQVQFEGIFRSTKDHLYGYIRKFIDSDDDAKDIVQQCYIRLWMNIEKVDDLHNVLPLLYTYSKNLIIDATRKKAVEKRNSLEYSYLLESVVDSDSLRDNKAVLEKMKKVLSKIPERKRTIFLLRKEEGLSTREIAERLHITPRAVRRHLEEAVLLLRNHLSSAELFTILIVHAASFSVQA